MRLVLDICSRHSYDACPPFVRAGVTCRTQREKRSTAERRAKGRNWEAGAGAAAAGIVGAAGASSSDIMTAPNPSAAPQASATAAPTDAHAAALSVGARGIEVEDALARFLMACAYVRYGGITKQLGPGVSIGTEQQLKLYGLYRQATRGPCTDPGVCE